jgi:hypothetical protein
MTKLKKVLAADALDGKFETEVKKWVKLGIDDKNWETKGRKINEVLTGILHEALEAEGIEPGRFSFAIWPLADNENQGRDYWGLRDKKSKSRPVIQLKVGTNGSETTTLKQALMHVSKVA